MENEEDNIKDKLCKHWKQVKQEYKLMKVLGAGTFGQVVYAKHRKTEKKMAIKFITGKLDSAGKVRNLIRELSILR